MDQRELVERARRGDHDAFAELAGAFVARLDAAARLILRDHELARDAVQEGFIGAWRNLPTLRDPDRFEAWLHRLIFRSCIDIVRHRGRRPFEVELLAVEVTYSEFGERGSVDVLGARRKFYAMIVVEVKSDLTVIDATIRKADEKERIVRKGLGRDRFGFTPRSVARLLVLPSTETARRRVRTSSTLLDAAFPCRAAEVRNWLRSPAGDLAGILFVSDTNPSSHTRVGGGAKRVRRQRVEQQ